MDALVAGNGSYIVRPCGHDLHGPTIFMQFLGKFGQIIGWRPPFGLAPHLLRNPGSGTNTFTIMLNANANCTVTISTSFQGEDKFKIDFLEPNFGPESGGKVLLLFH